VLWTRATPLALAAILVAMLAASAPAPAITYPSGFEEREVVGGLSLPMAAAWAPDGRLFVAEKEGRLKVVPQGGTTATTILDISDRVNAYQDRGLLGLAVDPDFASNGYVYLLYTYELSPLIADGNGEMVSRLGRFTVGEDNSVSAETVLLGSYVAGPCPPARNDLDCIPSDYDSHSIGTVRAAPDGTLWLGSGDASNYNIVDTRAFRSYDVTGMAGKILHVDRDGNGLPGHPHCPANDDLTDVCTKVHSSGFRNPFRFALRPGGGLVVGDVGWRNREEVDLISVPGRAYGWPCYEGTTRTPGARPSTRRRARRAPMSHRSTTTSTRATPR
jgi:glucose/arabinose dehydrogenase